MSALDKIVDQAWSEDAKVCAAGALKQLCPERKKKKASGLVVDHQAELHIMMSCKSSD
jgi:hypothetical protein